MTTLPAYKTRIQPDSKAAALASYASSSENHGYFGSFLGYLVDNDRPDDARLFLRDPGQLNPVSLDTLFQKLSHKRAERWSMALFEEAMQHPPALASSNDDDKPLTLSFASFFDADSEPRAARALELIIAAYGVDLPLKYGQTLLHAVADVAHGSLIARVLDAGARADKRNAWDQLPIETLTSSTSFGMVDASTLRRLSVGKFPKIAALSQFLLRAATSGPADPTTDERRPRTVEEIIEVVRTLIELGAPAGPFRDVVSPLGAALRLPLPTSERMKVADLLIESKRAGATIAEALPEVVKGYSPTALADALDHAGFTGDQTFGSASNTLLHIAVRREAEFWRDEFVERSVIPVIELLLARGVRVDATNAKGKTAFDLARKDKDSFGAHWKRVAALLQTAAPKATRTLARIEDTGFALGVAAALIDAKKLRKTTVASAFRSAEGEDEVELEAAAVEAMLELEVSDEALNSVRALSFSFEAEIYAMLEDATGADAGGESDVLLVASIEGVKALPRLEVLDLSSYGVGVSSLAPLASHPALKTLRISGSGAPFESAETLLTVPKLERIECVGDSAERLGAVASALAAKGVTITSAKLKAPAKKAPAKKKAPARR